jgi:hypothetical protein
MQARLSTMKLSLLPIPPPPLRVLFTITLYNSCHCFFTLCETSRGHFGNFGGPVLTHFTDVHFTPCQTMCPLPWQVDLLSLPSPTQASSISSGCYLHLPSRPLQCFTLSRSGLRPHRDSSDFARVVPSKATCFFSRSRFFSRTRFFSRLRFFPYYPLPVLMRPCGNSFPVSSCADLTLASQDPELRLTFAR